LGEAYGCFEICPTCFWEDDGVQLDDPNYAPGANAVSLMQAQQNFMAFGASERRHLPNVEPVGSAERDPNWRPFNPSCDGVDAAGAPMPYWLRS
jgi:hypothetical protein